MEYVHLVKERMCVLWAGSKLGAPFGLKVESGVWQFHSDKDKKSIEW